jgi:phosphoesterase RecJ-like protein
MNDLQTIAGVLKKSRKVIISGHITPDGDCVGSVLALGLALGQLEKDVTIALPEPVPEIFSFLPGVRDFLLGERALGGDYDTFVVLDCSVPGRLGVLRVLLERRLVVCSLDHHVSADQFAGYNYIDPEAAATAEIVQDLCPLLEVAITPAIATCLYTGIATDTGSFQYENTKPDTHRRAAILMEYGAPSGMINVQLHEQKPLAQLKVLAAVLPNLRLSTCGRVAWMSVTRELLGNLNIEDEHVNGLINYARSVRGVEVALLFREITPGRYKISFRSKESVDVNSLAALFGGGGHVRAAGCVLEGELPLVQEQVVRATLGAVKGQVNQSAGRP